MEDFFTVKQPDPYVSSLFKKHYTQINRNSAGGNDGDYIRFCLHSKTSTLRAIRNRTGNCSVPDEILDSLIIIEELDRHLGVPPSDALQRAFCAVAVHRTLCWLPVSWDDYYDAVRRIWGKLIKDLEVSGTSGLLSPGLAEWRKEIEASLCDRDTAMRLLRSNTLIEALRRIRAYLREFSGDVVASAPTALRRIHAYLREFSGDVVASAPTEGNVDNDVSTSTHHVRLSPHPSTNAGNEVNVVSASAEVALSPHRSTDGGNVDNAASASAHVLSSPDHYKKKKNKILRVNSHTKHKLHSSRRRHKGIVIAGLEEDWPSCPKDGFQSASEFNRLQQVPLNATAAALVDEVTDSLPKASDTVEMVASNTAINHCIEKGKRVLMVNPQTRCDPSSPRRHYEVPVTSERIESYEAAARKVHAEGSEGNENKEQGAPDEAIRKDTDRMDGSVLAPSEVNGNKDQGTPDEAVRKDIDMMDGNVPAPSVDHTAEPSQAQEGNEAFTSPKKVCRTNLMERNGTAHTFKWEDSIDVSPEVTDSCSNRCTLPSPITKHVSPLKIDEPKKWGRRRRVNRWTDEEEKALREGVQKYGKLWKHILESNQEIFRDRTAVDLKDKWRNLLRK